MMDYAELVKSLRICGEWGTDVRIPGEPSECDGCSYYDAEKDECKSWDAPWRKEHLLLDAADAIEEMMQKTRQLKYERLVSDGNGGFVRKSRWIPVTERLPKEKVCVLVFGGYFAKVMETAILDDGLFYSAWDNRTEMIGVTHWMPLPQAPGATDIYGGNKEKI